MWQLSTTFWFRVPLLQKQSISHRISTDRSFQFPLCVKGTTPLPTCRHNVIFRVSRHYTLRFPSSAYVLNSLSRFINRTKRFPPFGYACLSVELLQSSTVDCIVRCRRLYSPLQQTVQSIIVDCNNLPFKKPWLTVKNSLLLQLAVCFPLSGHIEDLYPLEYVRAEHTTNKSSRTQRILELL